MDSGVTHLTLAPRLIQKGTNSSFLSATMEFYILPAMDMVVWAVWIFIFRFLNKVFLNSIENMGYPVNSSKDDFGLALDSTGVKGYFTSNRPRGKGDDDLYFLKIKHIPVIVRGVIKDRDTKDVLSDATVSVINEAGNTLASSITRIDGQFEFEVDKGQQIYY